MKRFFVLGLMVIGFIGFSYYRSENIPPAAVKPTIKQKLPINTKTYKDGSYTGPITDAFYGDMQVKVSIKDSKISNVQFLKYPDARKTSLVINDRALPILRTETLAAQDFNVDIVTGATQTSHAYIQSLKGALNNATN